MTATKFTPGPWRWQDEEECLVGVYQVVMRQDEQGRMTFAEYPDGTHKDNAALIAAAPDMYEALWMAHAFIGDQYADAQSQALDGEYVAKEARPLWAAICSALAKAEGKA